MKTLKQALRDDCFYNIPEDLLNTLLDSREEICLQPNDILIPCGKVDDNIYILKSGIVRQAYFDGTTEKTNAFGTQGTIIISFHSYHMRTPSFFQIEACCETVVLKISKKEFDDLIKSSHEFAQWMLSLAHRQLWAYEMKLSVINGAAEERLRSLIVNRPDIMSKVPLKIIASYLGITPQYLSLLRKKLSSAEQ